MQIENKNTTKIIKLTNSERINRIISKICAAKLTVFIRSEQDTSTLAKGCAFSIEEAQNDSQKMLVIDSLSSKAVNYLFDKKDIQVEFAIFSAKITFKSKIKVLRNEFVKISFPNIMYSIERRSNSRFFTENDYPVFAKLSKLEEAPDSFITRPIFNQYWRLSNLSRLCDISLGGFCIYLSYPFFPEKFEKGIEDHNAQILFPMQNPIDIHITLKWIKKISENSKITHSEKQITSYRLGCEFKTVSDQLLFHIKQYVQQLNKMKAV